MAELIQDADDGFHEIQLSGKQVVFAFMLAVSAAVFIFLLGVQVGRGAKATAHAEEAGPVETTAAATPGDTGVPGTQSAAPLTTPPPVDAPATPTDNAGLSYPKRLESNTPVPDKLKAKPDDDPVAAAQPAPAPADPPASHAAAPAKDVAKSAPEKPAPAKAAAPSGARPGVWVVQLVALKDRSAATAVVQRLSAKGYPAFIVSPSPGSPSIYRVQVGRYSDRREAEQVARRLEKEEQFKPWISH
jgi:cell division septation protein DedD